MTDFYKNTKFLIKQLGGNGRVADLCGITPGAVSQWSDGIPAHHIPVLYKEAQNVGLSHVTWEYLHGLNDNKTGGSSDKFQSGGASMS